jgi:large conductance mechanosensitive channel
MIKEFVSFLQQYNVIGMAIWLLISLKVGELVKWLIDNLITPLILNPVLTKLKVKNMEELSYKWIMYWKLISTLIDFIVVALLVFFFVRYLNIKLK